MDTQVIPPTGPAAALQPGEIVAERYRLERELGRGSMGVVWSAVHVTLGQRVAIKLISPGQLESLEARQRFSTEAKAAARLKSRHAVQIYDDGQTADGTPFIVMEYLEGETLEAKLERGALSLPEAVRIISHVCRALSRAHAQGIIHRDLKPANIFIARVEDDEHGWLAKVLDFGVAKLTSSADPSHTKTGALVGTPLFMSPEQVRGAHHVDHRADLYSLGMVFYNMVTGRLAFDAQSYSDVLARICLDPLPDLSRVSSLPAGVCAWFERACARDPAQRFQSADEMAEALRVAASVAREERTSLPEEVRGPSGTVLGYAAPDPVESGAPDSERPVNSLGPHGTLKSPPPRAAAGPRGTAVLPVAVSDPSSTLNDGAIWFRLAWPLWLVAGMALGAVLAGTLILLVRGRSDVATAPSSSSASPIAPLGPLSAEPAPRHAASTNPAPLEAPSALPASPSPESAAPTASTSTQSEDLSLKGRSLTAKRPTRSPPPPRADASPEVVPNSTPAKVDPPDIGF